MYWYSIRTIFINLAYREKLPVFTSLRIELGSGCYQGSLEKVFLSGTDWEPEWDVKAPSRRALEHSHCLSDPAVGIYWLGTMSRKLSLIFVPMSFALAFAASSLNLQSEFSWEPSWSPEPQHAGCHDNGCVPDLGFLLSFTCLAQTVVR